MVALSHQLADSLALEGALHQHISIRAATVRKKWTPDERVRRARAAYVLQSQLIHELPKGSLARPV